MSRYWSALARELVPYVPGEQPRERDLVKLDETNVRLSKALWAWSTRNRVPFIYASSAATYGDGEGGFDDDNRVDALARLKPRERSLLLLAYSQGSSHHEIAESLGLKTGSVKALLFRARKRLASFLEEKES